MHSLAKKFMMARKLNFGEDGRAELLDDRVFLMDKQILQDLSRLTDEDTAYNIGESTGHRLAKNIQRTGISGTKMIEFMMDLLTMMGCGDFIIHDFDIADKTGEVRVKNCIIADEAESGETCSVIAGLLAGTFSENFDASFTAEEAACLNTGEDMCRFKISVT